ncbi:MAG: PAS domain S-box protein [Byssovorax sp.]
MSIKSAEHAVVHETSVVERGAFLDSILESSTEYAIVATDLDGVILSWNHGARRTYGYESTEVVGKASASLLHSPAEVASGRFQAILDGVRASGMWSEELQPVRKNGTAFRAFTTITLRRDNAGNPVGFTVISRDITNPPPILRDRIEAEDYHRRLFEANNDALTTTDTLGVIRDASSQMCEMTGVSREELIGSQLKQHFTDPKLAEDVIRRVLTEDRVTNHELVLRSQTGKTTVVSCNAATLRGAGGKLKGVFASARDITEQKRLEDDLRQVQNYTRGRIDASADALLTVDLELRITDVNELTSQMTGYSREELIGSLFTDYFTDLERASDVVKKTLAEGSLTSYVLALRSKDGNETLISLNASIFMDTASVVRGIFVSGRNITEQTRLEEELRQAQSYTRGLIEASLDSMFTVDAELTITDVNEQMVRLTEIEKSKLIGSRFDMYFTEPERAAAGVRETLRASFVTNYELTLRTPSGRQVLVSFNASIFKDAKGKVKGVFAVARDVTEQRRLEQELLEQQNYSRSLIEASVDALFTVDSGGRITYVNEQMVRLTGHGKQKLIGSPFVECFTEPEAARAGVEKAFEDEVVKNYELVVRMKSGAEAPVSFNASVFRDTLGRVAGIFASARDISDQRQLREKLVEQQAYTRGLIESNIDALMTTDALGIITDVNKQMCAVTGRGRDRLVGTPFKDYFTDPKRAEDGIRKVLTDGRVTNYELTLRAEDGQETFVSYNATTFTGDDGKLKGVFAAARDITDQKRLADQLRLAQNYSRGLIESSVDAMLTVDPDNTITEVNEQMVKLSGYTREQLVGTSFTDYFTEPDRAAAGVQRTLSDGFVTNYELTLRSRHRRQILVSFNASVFKDTDGNVRGIFAVARDVTDQRRLEEKLRESENYTRGLIESFVDALVTVNPDLTITDANEQMVRLTGFSREDLVGSPFKDYFTEPARAATGVRQTLYEGSVTNYELVLKSRSGKRTVISLNAGTFKDTEGRVAGVFAAVRDITAQKRLEDQLRDQQNYNRSLIESSVDALMIVDPSGVITEVTEQTIKLSGYNRKQLVGSPFIDYFTDGERATAGVQKTFDDGAVTNYELVLRSKSGRKIPVSFNAAVYRDTTGTVAGILAAARDITQQKQIEQALREQQTYTRGLIESNIDALMTTDTIGIITDVNKQMCAVTGCTQEELIGTPFKDYFTDPKLAEDGIRQVLAEDRVTNYELTIRSKDGKESRVSYNATTFKGADGKLRGVFAAARDITAQKRLEEQIREQNRELTETTAFMNNVLESSTGYSIIAMDLVGKILAWNEGARRNYGYVAEEMVGKQNSRTLHAPEDVESGRVTALLDTALTTGKAEGVFDRIRQNGQRFPASLAVTLRRDGAGRPIGYVLISKDITEQQQLEEQLRRKNEELEEQNCRVQEANRLKSEFLANMSHELRTPLNGIIGFAELMHDAKVGPVSADHKEYLGDILTSSRHLLQLINDVLDLAKVESGKMEFRPERVDLAKLVSEVRDILRTLTAEKRIHLTCEVDPRLGAIQADPAKLKQVLYNYLSNALKFTPEKGHVTIRARPEGDARFRLEVEDTGIGIRSEDFSRLFIEFQQLDGSSAKKYQGTGLGLALTRRIVEAQGGEIGVTSTPGVGSTFYAILPQIGVSGDLNAGEREQAPTTAREPGQRVVLVVEDDARERAWITDTLAAAGYASEAVASGAAAIRAARERSFDAVTLDLLLPDRSGWDVLREIRATERNRDVPAIVVTVIAEKSAGLGFVIQDFLVKPVRLEELVLALERTRMPAGERSLLIIDDDPNVAKIVEPSLRALGFQVTVVRDGESGLAAVAAHSPSVVLLDLLMPGMDGFEFLHRFRLTEAGHQTPVIIWTVKDLTSAERARLQASAQAIVLKGAGSADALIAELTIHLHTPNPDSRGE